MRPCGQAKYGWIVAAALSMALALASCGEPAKTEVVPVPTNPKVTAGMPEEVAQIVSALVIDPAAPATLYAGTRNGVFKSTDGGGNWVAVNTGLRDMLPISALAIDPAMSTTLYAGSEWGGVYKSTNGGGNWVAVNTGLPDYQVNDLAIDPAAPTTLYAGTAGGGVFKSTDGGGSWSAANTGLPDMTMTGVSALAIDPATHTTLYAGTGTGAFKSTDGARVGWRSIPA